MNKILLSVVIALLPIAAVAEETNDTTVIYGGKKIVINADSMETKVDIYDHDGQKLTKTKESVYINGTEVERVFVGSPFIPDRDLQTMYFRPAFPTVWYGFNNLTKGFSSNDNGPTRVRRTGSFELGVTPYAIAIPLSKSKTYGFSAAAQLVFARYSFEKDFAMRNSGAGIERIDCPSATKNNMYFGALRIPVMFNVQTTDGTVNFGLGVSLEARTNAKYNFSAPGGLDGIPDGLRLNRFGLNFETSMDYTVFHLRCGCGITPLFKTTDGVKAYQASIQLGIDIPNLVRQIKKSKKK